MSRTTLRLAAVLAVLTVVAAACGGGTDTETSGSAGAEPVAGGTLKIGVEEGYDFFNALDPTQEYYSWSWEVLRCCMTRMLLSYNGKSLAEGGAEPLPDLATALPTVSDDGLVYTFTLKDGVEYGDPLNKPIVAADFINSINRMADLDIATNTYPFYYTTIEGFQDVVDGKADSVSGFVAPDEKTLEVHLTIPDPNVAYYMTMPAMTPIPDELMETHYEGTEMGQFWVSTGPYQYEGMEGFDLSSNDPPTGSNFGKDWVFVRNPSWDQATDDLRPAYLDRIEIQVGGETQDLLDKVDSGVIDWCSTCDSTAVTLTKYHSDPELESRLKINASDAIVYTGLNVFQPPFDDVHVRKAVNWALNRAAMLRLGGGPDQGVITSHFVPPSMLGGLNADYDPYPSEGDQGDPVAAMEEMKLSKYDTDGDGVCDGDACTIDALTTVGDSDAVKAIQIMSESFAPIGLTLVVKTLGYNALQTKCSDLESHTAFCQASWGKDFPSPVTFYTPLLDGGENGSNYSYLGITEDALTAAGYEVPADGIPTIHDEIAECNALDIGSPQNECWAALDRLVSEEIVPNIPRRFPNDIDVLGARIASYSYDQWAGIGAIDHMSLVGGGA